MNGLQALKALETLQPGVPEALKQSYRVNSKRRIYAGHSMGGHGCMIYSTLQPEFVLGSVCASGWIRRDLYIASSLFSPGVSRIDHFRAGLMQLSLDEYSTDLHLTNMKQIPILLRMGTEDDTVPCVTDIEIF
jgi:predicted peptidase